MPSLPLLVLAVFLFPLLGGHSIADIHSAAAHLSRKHGTAALFLCVEERSACLGVVPRLGIITIVRTGVKITGGGMPQGVLSAGRQLPVSLVVVFVGTFLRNVFLPFECSLDDYLVVSAEFEAV